MFTCNCYHAIHETFLTAMVQNRNQTRIDHIILSNFSAVPVIAYFNVGAPEV